MLAKTETDLPITKEYKIRVWAVVEWKEGYSKHVFFPTPAYTITPFVSSRLQ
jgi:hypothetical protein